MRNVKSLNVYLRKGQKTKPGMNQNRTEALLARVKKYLKDNLGAPFIVVFMLLLSIAAVSLTAGLSSFAYTAAVYAFCALVIGAALQFVSFVKYTGRDDSAV
jgi:hypothetical protein